MAQPELRQRVPNLRGLVRFSNTSVSPLSPLFHRNHKPGVGVRNVDFYQALPFLTWRLG